MTGAKLGIGVMLGSGMLTVKEGEGIWWAVLIAELCEGPLGMLTMGVGVILEVIRVVTVVVNEIFIVAVSLGTVNDVELCTGMSGLEMI
jgi:hypothetical protein